MNTEQLPTHSLNGIPSACIAASRAASRCGGGSVAVGRRLNVLVARESSGTVREAFRRRGHNAWSCDLLPADDGSEYHSQTDARYAIREMMTETGRDMMPVECIGWDLVIAHPPCTHLASSGARHFAAKQADGRQQQGIDLFMAIVDACQKYAKAWAIENPIGIMSRLYRKPDQILHPWQFGHDASKATCLWVHNLRLLAPTKFIAGRRIERPDGTSVYRFANQTDSGQNKLSPTKDRWKLRSKTYQGIADAMAAQWGGVA